MSATHLKTWAVWACSAVIGLSASVAAAQTPSATSPATPTRATQAPAPSVQPRVEMPLEPDVRSSSGNGRDRFVRGRGPFFRMGQDLTLPANEVAEDVVVVSGRANVEGHARGDVVVVLGSVHVGKGAVVDGSLVAVAGDVTIEDGAIVHGDFVSVASTVTAPETFRADGEHVLVGAGGMGRHLGAVVPWLTKGLLWGRLIVPSVGWMWPFIAVLFFVSLMLNLAFDGAVRACARTLFDRPLSTFFMGLLMLLLIGPVMFILVVSVVGIAVIPFVLCALVIAWIIGKVGVTRWIGASLVSEEADNRIHTARSFAIGFGILCLAYMVPILGIMSWVVVSVFGLGAAIMALATGLRRENPSKPKPPKPVPSSATATQAGAAAPFTTSPAFGAGDAAQMTGGVVGGVAAAGADAAGMGSGASSGQFISEPAGQYSSEPAGTFASEPAATWTPASSAAEVPRQARRPVSASDLLGRPHADFMDRAAAFALDVLLIAFVSAVLDFNRPKEFFGALLVYHIVFWMLKGTTVGGIITNLRVIRTDGGQLQPGDAIIRGLSSIFSIVVLGIGCFWILMDAEKQAWHDRFAGTYVVKVPRDWPLP